MNWLVNLFSKDDGPVCCITVCGVACVITLVGITIWQPGWNPMPYAGGAATIIGTIAGGKRWRDGPANGAPQ